MKEKGCVEPLVRKISAAAAASGHALASCLSSPPYDLFLPLFPPGLCDRLFTLAGWNPAEAQQDGEGSARPQTY